MQLETLKMFIDIIRLQNISEAAATNGITQSRLSQILKALEEKIGTVLVDRSFRPWQTTEAGEIFYHHSIEIISKYNQLLSQVKAKQEEKTQVLYIAAIYSMKYLIDSKKLKEYEESNPEIVLKIDYLHPKEVLEKVYKQRADFGIISFPENRKEMSAISWKSEPFVVACWPGHEFSSLKSVELKDIQNENLISLNRSLYLRRRIDRYFRECDVRIKTYAEFDSIDAIKEEIKNKKGISILPQSVVLKDKKNNQLSFTPLANPEFERSLGFIYRQTSFLNDQTRALLDYIKTI